MPSIRSALAAVAAAGLVCSAADPASARGSVGVFIGAGPPVYYVPPPPPPPPPVFFAPRPYRYVPPPPVYYVPPPVPRPYYAPPPAYRYWPY